MEKLYAKSISIKLRIKIGICLHQPNPQARLLPEKSDIEFPGCHNHYYETNE